jgi:hypothetical protein
VILAEMAAKCRYAAAKYHGNILRVFEELAVKCRSSAAKKSLEYSINISGISYNAGFYRSS